MYVGPLCAVCSEGFTYQASAQKCEPCSNSSQFDMYIAVFIAICLVLVGVAGWYFIPRMRVLGREIKDADDLVVCACLKMGILISPRNNSSSSYDMLKSQAHTLLKRFTHRIKFYVILWQIGSILPFALDLRFPDLYAWVVSAAQVLHLSVSKSSLIGCSSAGYDAIDALVIDTSLPLILVTLLWIASAVHIAIASSYPDHRREKAIHSLRSRYFNAFMIYTFVILPGISAQIFSVFSCGDVDPDEVNDGDDSYMTADYSVSCSSAKYHFGLAWAIAMVFVYPIGIPLFYFILLYRSRLDIQTRNDPSLSTEQSARLSQRTDSIQSLFQFYKPRLWYWEVVETISRLMLTGVLVVIAQGSAIQIVVGVAFSIIIIHLHNHLEPYLDPNLQVAKRISNWQICGLFFVALLLKADFGSIQRSALAVCLLLILFSGAAYDICLLMWHYALLRSATPELQGLSHKNPAQDILTVSSKVGGTHHFTPGRSIDLVACDPHKKGVDEGGGGRSIINSSPLHEERL
jgi:hypothetical protein